VRSGGLGSLLSLPTPLSVSSIYDRRLVLPSTSSFLESNCLHVRRCCFFVAGQRLETFVRILGRRLVLQFVVEVIVCLLLLDGKANRHLLFPLLTISLYVACVYTCGWVRDHECTCKFGAVTWPPLGVLTRLVYLVFSRVNQDFPQGFGTVFYSRLFIVCFLETSLIECAHGGRRVSHQKGK
jgi:hypothetical protein